MKNKIVDFYSYGLVLDFVVLVVCTCKGCFSTSMKNVAVVGLMQEENSIFLRKYIGLSSACMPYEIIF